MAFKRRLSTFEASALDANRRFVELSTQTSSSCQSLMSRPFRTTDVVKRKFVSFSIVLIIKVPNVMKYTGPKFKLCRREGINLFGSEKYDLSQ
jgi:hypothetical protein